MKIKNIFVTILAALPLLFGSTACDKYVSDHDDVAFSLSLKEGEAAGEGVLFNVFTKENTTETLAEFSVKVTDKDSGMSPEFTVEPNSDEPGKLSFDAKGEASFTIKGLPSGNYTLFVTVQRLFHKASGSIDFTI